MNKNGFTLIEMLAVIVIMAALSTFVGIGVVSILDKERNKNYEEYTNTIEMSACSMVEMTKYNNIIITTDNKTLNNCKSNKTCTISTEKLISEGLLREDLNNPQLNKTVVNSPTVVIVTWSSDGEKTCAYQKTSEEQ